LDLPKGVKTLTLPDNPGIRVFALSFGAGGNDATVAAQRLYD
jgi:hypothetical protein